MNDTIAAISTAFGIGAVAIIRVSGQESIDIVNSIFKGTNLCKKDSHTIHYGHIIDKTNIIDEVLVTILRSPKTFTCEDVVEINCHGGIATIEKILELLLKTGCRLAEPGEFTKRAFLNGRIDLIEAEGVMDLINAKTDQARILAMNSIKGTVSKLIKNVRKEIIEILANIEVNIDYPEYEDIKEVTIEDLKIKVKDLENKIKHILLENRNGKIIKEGINVTIIGKPNVGKSSLLNNLLGEKKAIVTNIPGTTRDIVEGTVNLEGIIINITDTAGIRETTDQIEKLGIEKSLEYLERSDLILYLLANNEPLEKEEKELYEKIKSKKHIVIINKMDLPSKLDIKSFDKNKIVTMTLLENKGIELLTSKIKNLFNLNELNQSDLTYLSNARTITILEEILVAIKDINKAISIKLPIDIIEIDIKNVWNLLGKIIGESYEEELIDQLFSQFCLGK